MKIENRKLKIEKRFALSGWLMILAWLGMLIFACHACTHMVAAGDTWVALACGRHFVNHGVDTVEPFSANSHKPGPTPQEIETWPQWAQWITNKVGLETVKKWHPTGWINQNWLTHVIFYWLCTTFGSEENPNFNALVYWKFAIYILTVICLFYTGVTLGVNPALSSVLACFAMFIGRSFFDIRPAGFSNLLVAVFLFILVFTTYRNILYVWLIVPLTVFWCNVHGGYIYAFIVLIPFIGLHLLTSLNKKWTAILYNVTAWPFYYLVVSYAGLRLDTFLFLVLLIVLDFVLIFFKKDLISIGFKGIYHTIAAGIIAFLAMVLFNPFHLTNLTHTFVISVSEHAARWRDIHEWQAAFDWDNPVGTAVPFLAMYILAWVILVIWALALILTVRSVSRYPKRKTKALVEYQWPKIDLPLILIAALTIYMAIRSRRFIPISAFAACPVTALLIDQITRAISALRNFRLHNPRSSRGLVILAMPSNLRLVFTFAGAAAVLFFGIWWGLKFKYIYLNPWPSEINPKLCTIFMRMTASDAKPFDVGRFIKDNKLKGKMFNYWTEGGFIAWAQEPDPNTGKTPLQLFMDGRAQAAYNREVFDLWSIIMSGGRLTADIVASAEARNQSISASDYEKIGQWMDNKLKEYDVWVFLMPAAVYNDPEQKSPYHVVKGLEYNRNWPLVFFNNEQKLFVDYNSPQGKELFDGIRTGKTLYPDDFHRSLILAHHLLLYGQGTDSKRQGLDYAIKAFNLNPSAAPMMEIILLAARFAELRPLIDEFCKNYFDSFVKNKDTYANQNGYRLKVQAAHLAGIHLEKVAREQRDAKLANFYDEKTKEFASERDKMFKRW